MPYTIHEANGSHTVQFKRAALGLTVKPLILSNGQTLLTIKVNKDSLDTASVSSKGGPIIDTRELETQVIVQDKERIVLGGIYETKSSNDTEKIPLLSKLPLIGQFFQSTAKQESKNEILIFISATHQHNQVSE